MVARSYERRPLQARRDNVVVVVGVDLQCTFRTALLVVRMPRVHGSLRMAVTLLRYAISDQ
jgi:hypothetical protein